MSTIVDNDQVGPVMTIMLINELRSLKMQLVFRLLQMGVQNYCLRGKAKIQAEDLLEFCSLTRSA